MSAVSKHNARIDLDRLMGRLRDLGTVGALEGGGVCRLALTDSDKAGRDRVTGWMRALGLRVSVDRIGNMVGVRPGREDLPPVMIGSHIDTVATGGLYDGNLGVLAGLEVVSALDDAGIATRRPIAVAAFTNEEGARFAPDMMGSAVDRGALGLEEALSSPDTAGRTVGEELARIGYVGEAEPGHIDPHCFFELHVEQGPVLEEEGFGIGAVTGVQGISWMEYIIEGVSNHAGTTSMRLRHDAGYVAAAISVAARRIASRFAGDQVATVGVTELNPGLVNVIARRARVTVDLRNTDEADTETRRGRNGVRNRRTGARGRGDRRRTPAGPLRARDVRRRHGRSSGTHRPGPRQPGQAPPVGRRSRRTDVRARLSHRDDLRPLARRDQPQRQGTHRPGTDPRRRGRVAERGPRQSRLENRKELPMSRRVVVAAAQLGPVAREESRTSVSARMIALMRAAADRGAGLVVFPELALTTFFPRWYMEDRAELDAFFETEMPGPETRPLFEAARDLRVGFYLGYAERVVAADGDRHFNTSILVDATGAIVGKYRKIHLPGHEENEPWRPFQHLERRYFETGDLGFRTFEAFGGKIGMCLCNDRRWPESYRVLALRGAEMILIGYNTPAHYPPAPEHDHLQDFHNHLVMQAGAYQNGAWVVGVAKAGREEGCDLIGGSCVIDPTGQIVARCETLDDEIVCHDCDLDRCAEIRGNVFDFTRYREPEHYRVIAER